VASAGQLAQDPTHLRLLGSAIPGRGNLRPRAPLAQGHVHSRDARHLGRATSAGTPGARAHRGASNTRPPHASFADRRDI